MKYSVINYFKFQLRRKLKHPIRTLCCVISPILIFFISYATSFKLNDNVINYNQSKLLLLQAQNSLSYVFLVFIVYDLVHEKKIFRKHYILSFNFESTFFYMAWLLLYLIMIIPSIIVISFSVFFLDILPRVSFTIILFTLFSILLNNIIFAMWISLFFKRPNIGSIFGIFINILICFIYFCYNYFDVSDNENDINDIINGSSTFTVFSSINIFDYLVNSSKNGYKVNLFSDAGMSYLILLLILYVNIGIFSSLTIYFDTSYLSKHIVRLKRDEKRENFFKEGCLHIIRPYSGSWKKKRRFLKIRSLTQRFSGSESMDMLNGDDDDADDEITEDESPELNHSINSTEKSLFLKTKVLINVKNLFKTYSFDKNLAINNVSFEVYDNDIFAIVGKKGAGKSTLMKMLYGRLPSSYGNIEVNGWNMNFLYWLEISKSISVMPKEDYVFFPDETVADHINFYTNITFHTEHGLDMLKKLNFRGQPTDIVKNLDHTDKNKLKIVLALLKNRKMLFLEEPTNGMTKQDQHLLWNEIKSYQNQKTIIFSTESLEEAYRYATTILYLEDGKILSLGDKNTVLNNVKDKHKSCQVEINLDYQD